MSILLSMHGIHTHPTHLDSFSGADLRASGDWRLYLVRQFSEIMELLGRKGAARHERANAGGADGPDLEAPEIGADTAACTCGANCVSTREGPKLAPSVAQPLDPLMSAHAERALEVFTTRQLSQYDFGALWIDAAYVLGRLQEGHARQQAVLKAKSGQNVPTLGQKHPQLTSFGRLTMPLLLLKADRTPNRRKPDRLLGLGGNNRLRQLRQRIKVEAAALSVLYEQLPAKVLMKLFRHQVLFSGEHLA